MGQRGRCNRALEQYSRRRKDVRQRERGEDAVLAAHLREEDPETLSCLPETPPVLECRNRGSSYLSAYKALFLFQKIIISK